MKISKRLQKIAEMVKYPTVADIGTDHGHLPIYLAQRGSADKLLATDANAGPLGRARRNIAEAGLSHRVQTRLCDGLDGVNPAEYAACVISGMGGGLIINILRQNLPRAQNFRQLLLSPQRDVACVRRFLHQCGFRIDDEEMLEEKGVFYNILDASPGNEAPYDEKGYVFGDVLLRKRPDALKIFVKSELEKARKIERRDFQEYLQLCEEALRCL
ncbi:MAG: class I SAM-dependent methyltransferase [Clostridiales bacterium]|jgi:tRNA (adenine22-N1)-methyltransferase|nr:class I SAM-dependent methyltransferase [Clostridiales bacterium]